MNTKTKENFRPLIVRKSHALKVPISLFKNVKRAQVFVLAYLLQHGDEILSEDQIARSLNIKKMTVTITLFQLKKLGILKKKKVDIGLWKFEVFCEVSRQYLPIPWEIMDLDETMNLRALAGLHYSWKQAGKKNEMTQGQISEMLGICRRHQYNINKILVKKGLIKMWKTKRIGAKWPHCVYNFFLSALRFTKKMLNNADDILRRTFKKDESAWRLRTEQVPLPF